VRRIQNATFTRPIRADTSIRGPTTPTNASPEFRPKTATAFGELEVVPGSGEGERGGLCVVAMDTSAFHLAFQPLIDFKGGELIGLEALLRWPEGWEPQSPATFIPVAEEAGLIVPIGAWVLKTACNEAAAWTRPLKIAVNLSPLQFSCGDIVAVVDEVLMSSGLDPCRLELEVTESLWLQNTETVLDQLARLRSR
jgi:EAL domain-containing protein (putative c-di-GMP-specific phosphodiesterase class I)